MQREIFFFNRKSEQVLFFGSALAKKLKLSGRSSPSKADWPIHVLAWRRGLAGHLTIQPTNHQSKETKQ